MNAVERSPILAVDSGWGQDFVNKICILPKIWKLSGMMMPLPRSTFLLRAHVPGPGISIYTKGAAANCVFPALTQGYMLV